MEEREWENIGVALTGNGTTMKGVPQGRDPVMFTGGLS